MKKILDERFKKHYHPENKKRYFNIVADSILMLTILTLVGANIYLSAKNSGSVLGIDYQSVINIIKEEPETAETNVEANIQTATSTAETNVKTEAVKPIIKATDVKFFAFARYFTIEGEQLGIGPLPPTVGDSTNFWIFLSVRGFTHDLQNVNVSATLPQNVTLTGQSSISHGENITLNEKGQIVWKIGDLKANETNQVIGAAFEVKITPTADQTGQTANLLENIAISATDTAVNQEITKTAPQITTYLINDKIANNDGVIK